MTRATSKRQHVDDPGEDAAGGQMSFLDHLDELRTRIIRSLIAIGTAMLVAFFFADRIGAFILGPALRALPPGQSLIYTKPGEGFSFYLDTALIGGLVLAAPFVMYQVWGFVAPGLYAREKKYVIPFVALTTLGSLGGAAFTHYVMFPGMIAFFRSFDSPLMRFMPRVEDTFELYKNMMIGMVAVFQMPTLVFFLAKMQMVTARFLWRHLKYAILIIFIVAAALTSSTDPWNQTIYAAPMIVLYLISIVIAWVFGPREKGADASESSTKLRLVIAATVIDQARRNRPGRYPAAVRRTS